MKVICVGSSARDIFFPVKEGMILNTPEDVTSQRKIVFEAGSKYHVDDRFESLGGCAVNQACGLVRLGIAAACYTSVGNDADGEWIIGQMAERGVGIELIRREECKSGLSAIIVDQNSGERVIFSNQEANERLRIEKKQLDNCEWISVSDPNGDWKDILADVCEVVEKNSLKLAFNPRGKNIQENAKKVFEIAGATEIFFVNKDEAIEILVAQGIEVGARSEEYLLGELKKSGARIVVITDGERGAWAYDGNSFVHVEAEKIENVADTTGAGDAFASAFLAAYIKGKKLEECVRWGIKNGGNVVRFYGGVEGLLAENEL